MKIRLPNGLLIIDILTVLLVLAILVIPSSFLRIALGLPFLLFFPGYVLVAALFAREKDIDGIEKIALSFGMSIAVTALIGLGLNYTPWGIRLEPVLFTISAFIFILSGLAMLRQRQYGAFKLFTEHHLRLSGWEESPLNKALSIILAIAILSTVGVLIYTVSSPKVGEHFTEFYILGLEGKAIDYPAKFTLRANRVASVRYGDAATAVSGTTGRIILGIVNQEQQQTIYSVSIQIDGQPVNITYNGQNVSRLNAIPLEQGEKWEGEIGFAPMHTGENQKVEFLLYKDGSTEAYNSLHLWVNVVTN
ncbi:DUF1616 domain-containing protein [Chloroflexota bacterium]